MSEPSIHAAPSGPGQITTVSVPPAITLTTPPFPSRYAHGVVADATLQSSVDKVVAQLPPEWRGGFALVAFGESGARRLGAFRGDQFYYAASQLKLAAMYAAFELRSTLRAIAAELGTATSQATLLREAARYLDPLIVARAAAIPALKDVRREHAVPQYASTFKVVKVDGGRFDVEFSDAFAAHLRGMLVTGTNPDAGHCVHGSGYGYINGALESAGLFDPAAKRGVWLAGDYDQGYPPHRIPCANDTPTAQGTTAIALAQMLTLLVDKKLVGGASSSDMLDLMGAAAEGGHSFLGQAQNAGVRVLHTKVGLGWTNDQPDDPRHQVSSEASIIQHPGGRQFVFVWVNHTGSSEFLGEVIRCTLADYLLHV